MEVDFGFKLYVPYYWSHEGVVVKDADHLFNLRKRDLFDILPPDEKNTIDKAIKLLLEKYKCKTSKELESEIYRDTPFPFQNEFRKFLMVVRGWKGKRTLDNYFKCGNADALNILKKLEETFPQNEFEDLYPLFLEWKNFTEYLVKHDKSRVETGLLVDKFSFLFKKKLKVMAHENIYPETVKHWKSDYEKSHKDFEKFLFDCHENFNLKLDK